MIRSLRSLLNLMKLFNGNFSPDYDADEDFLDMFALSLLYDGASLAFTDRSEPMPISLFWVYPYFSNCRTCLLPRL